MSVLVGRKAPDFTVSAVLGDGEITDKFNLYETLNGQYGVVFFYPLDFTFVCPSELIALNNRMAAFRERQTQVIAVSIDSQFTHNAYRNTPVESGGIGPITLIPFFLTYFIAGDIIFFSVDFFDGEKLCGFKPRTAI